MQCKWENCENDARAKSPFCSGTCKKRYQRASGTSVPVEVGQGQVGHDRIVPVAEGCAMVQVGLDHYRTCPDQYIPRREPDKLNWGPWMNSQQLEQAGLKANRVSIPGDWDYVGVAQHERQSTNGRQGVSIHQWAGPPQERRRPPTWPRQCESLDTAQYMLGLRIMDITSRQGEIK